MSQKQRPFLKWAGGKYRLLDRIAKELPKGKRLIEPFVGSGVVFINSHYPKYLLNDINPDLINLYKILQNDGEHFIAEARSLFCEENNQEHRYKEIREQFNQSSDAFERSLLFLYMNRHGYNGLCRYNLKGGFNVPFGRYKKPFFPEESLRLFIEKTRKARFSNKDFVSLINQAKEGDVVYCDPPYAPLSATSNFTSYSQHAFNTEQQVLLAKVAGEASARGATVIISNHDTKETRSFYESAKLKRFKVRRNISADPKRRNLVPELFALYKP